jgi:hypothetical protein
LTSFQWRTNGALRFAPSLIGRLKEKSMAHWGALLIVFHDAPNGAMEHFFLGGGWRALRE